MNQTCFNLTFDDDDDYYYDFLDCECVNFSVVKYFNLSSDKPRIDKTSTVSDMGIYKYLKSYTEYTL